jgi:hypothetical protein
MRAFLTAAICITLFGVLFPFQSLPVHAGGLMQEGESPWTAPVNLSRSGAASHPRIVAGPDGQLQVFWWDAFDGIVTSVFDGQIWSKPALAPIQSKRLETTPHIVSDASGQVNAFWLDNDGKQMYSQLKFGTASWSNPVRLAESAAAYDVIPVSADKLAQAYIRPLNTAPVPAGIYFMKQYLSGSWSVPVSIYTNIYFRPATPKLSYIRMARLISAGVSNGPAGTTGLKAPVLGLAWDDPKQRQALFSYSMDGGMQWQKAETMGTGEGASLHPRLASLPEDNGALRIWEESGQSRCKLYQQSMLTGVDQASVISNTQSLALVSWSDPVPILETLSTCPQDDHFWPYQEGVIWIWGEGSEELTLTNWQPESGQWTLPVEHAIRFKDDETSQSVNLGDLHALVSGDQVAVVGADSTTNEIWVTMAQASELGMSLASRSLWAMPAYLTIDNQPKGSPAVKIDREGLAHVVWSVTSEQSGPESPGVALYYTRANSSGFARAVEIIPPVEDKIAIQPDLELVSNPKNEVDLLHLVWSGESGGQVLYSRSITNEAFNPNNWSPPQIISPHSGARWPKIGADLAGHLYVLYSVPLNETRGIYLVSSADGGKTWSEPVQVFDAVAAGWQMVDHPTLSVAPDGVLRAAWVNASLPGTGVSQGIVYSYSMDGGQSWSVPLELSAPGYDWPRLAVAGGQLHMLFIQAISQRIFYRWKATGGQSEDEGNWSVISSVPGYQNDNMPFSLWATPERLYLIIENPSSVGFSLSIWNSSEQPRSWSSPEQYTLSPYAEYPAGTFSPANEGITVAAQPLLGTLAVIGLAPEIQPVDESQPADAAPPAVSQRLSLYFTTRDIPIESAPRALSPRPAPTEQLQQSPATQTPTSEPEILFTPIPTFTVSQMPMSTGSAIPPLAWGGGLAALIVVAIFAGYLLWMRSKS